MRIIYDGDFGIDDSVALLTLAAAPDVELLGVGSVHGNTSAAQAAANALAVLDLLGQPGTPVAVGAARALANPTGIDPLVHGDDGLGGRAPLPSRPPLEGISAAEQLVHLVRAHPRACTVVATGPLTNLALALLLDPGIVPLVERVVVMGGTLTAPGNITPWAEANLAGDPEAADLVLRSGLPLTLVGLDVTMATWLGPTDLDRLAAHDGGAARFVTAILGHYLDFYAGRHGRMGCPLHDETAAIITLDPSVATYLDAPAAVELAPSATRGMLLVDRRAFAHQLRPADATDIRIAVGVESATVVERVVTAICSL